MVILVALMIITVVLSSISVLLLIFSKISTPGRRDFENAMRKTFDDLGFEKHLTKIEEKAGALDTKVKEVRELHTDIEKLLKTPSPRGSFGEAQLEDILSKHLPEENFGIRERLKVGIPDAHIESTEGTICIDSKFPLKNYHNLINAKDEDKEEYRKKFRENVEEHLEKVTKYIRPDKGTIKFVLAFIPSEPVFYYLIKNESDLLRKYHKRGVVVVSPYTILSYLRTIRSNIVSKKLSEEAEAVKEKIKRLEPRFRNLSDVWETLRRHRKNARKKANKFNSKFEDLREEFFQIIDEFS